MDEYQRMMALAAAQSLQRYVTKKVKFVRFITETKSVVFINPEQVKSIYQGLNANTTSIVLADETYYSVAMDAKDVVDMLEVE